MLTEDKTRPRNPEAAPSTETSQFVFGIRWEDWNLTVFSSIYQGKEKDILVLASR